MKTIVMASPIGPLRVVTTGDALVGVEFLDGRVGGEPPAAAEADPVVARLARYFAGDIVALDAIPVAAATGTPFQHRVWDALRGIPAGRTVSYGDLARTIGQPGAVRAVGTANGRNPIPVVVPCHRVVRTGGGLGGYAGGPDRKRWLLDHERHHLGLVLSEAPRPL